MLVPVIHLGLQLPVAGIIDLSTTETSVGAIHLEAVTTTAGIDIDAGIQ